MFVLMYKAPVNCDFDVLKFVAVFGIGEADNCVLKGIKDRLQENDNPQNI